MNTLMGTAAMRITKEFKWDMKKNVWKEKKYEGSKIIRFAKEGIFKH